MLGIEHKLHSAVVNVEVVELDFRIFLGLHFSDDFAPHTAGAEYVGLINAGYLAAAFFGSLEGEARNAFYLRAGVQLDVACFLNAVGVEVRFGMLAEVDAAGQLTHD